MQTDVIASTTKAEKVFSFFLHLYPATYRKKFGEEMRVIFTDMYDEELATHGNIGLHFWLSLFGDITKSVIQEHIDEVEKKGMKRYLKNTLHLNGYNIISFILLLPFLSLFGIDFVSRILHDNRQAALLLQHSFFYTFPILFTGIVIFPILAMLCSVFPLVSSLSKKQVSIFSWGFVLQNFLTIAFLGLGLLALLIVFGHDVIPCTIHGLFNLGVLQIGHIIAVCKQA